MNDAYKKAGVSIDRGNEFVEKIKAHVSKTNRIGVMGSIGGFGGLFALDFQKYKAPVLVSGTDGVGTKLKLAIEMGQFDTIGQDLVAMCINDIACSGAEPLFFLDYLATGKLDPDKHSEVIKGIALACKECKCALIGGETAEMPGMYNNQDFDLAGFAVGIVEKEEIIDGHTIGLGDSIIGIESSGFHSNGYSLLRQVIKDNSLDLNTVPDGFDKTLGEMLITPTKLYSNLIQRLKGSNTIKAISHITGGGIVENLPRVLPSSVQAKIEKDAWSIPPIFRYIQEVGKITETEMLRVFNCGIGLIVIAPNDEVDAICDTVKVIGESAHLLGRIEKRVDGQVIIR